MRVITYVEMNLTTGVQLDSWVTVRVDVLDDAQITVGNLQISGRRGELNPLARLAREGALSAAAPSASKVAASLQV